MKKFFLSLILLFSAPLAASAAFDPSLVPTKATITQLRANVQPVPTIQVQGYSAVGDGGGGAFVYVASDTTSSDNGCTIFIDAANHRYYRSPSFPIHTSYCNGSDIGAQVNNAYAALPSTGGTIVIDPASGGGCINYTTGIVLATQNKYPLLTMNSPGGQTATTGGNCLNYTPTGSTAAITLDYANVSYGPSASSSGLENITLINNGCTTSGGCGSSAIGIQVGVTNAGDFNATMRQVTIKGFGTAYENLNNSAVDVNWIAPNFQSDAVAMTIAGATEHFIGGTMAGNGKVFVAPSGTSQSELYFLGTNLFDNRVSPVFDYTAATAGASIEMTSVHLENAPDLPDAHYFQGNFFLNMIGGALEDDSSTGTGDWFIQPTANYTMVQLLGTKAVSNRIYTAIINMPNLTRALIIPEIVSGTKFPTIASGAFASNASQAPMNNYANSPVPWSFYSLVNFPQNLLLTPTVVGSLPTCNSAAKGEKATVTDATTPTFLGSLTGGGSTEVGVGCNGTAWVPGG